MRAPIKVAVGLAAALALTAVTLRVTGTPEPAAAVVAEDRGDSGDEQVLTSYDGAMVRQRAAIGVLPAKGADPKHIRAELQAVAKGTVGKLSEATFAVFDPEVLALVVPQVTFVLPENITLSEADAFMRDHQPADVAFYVVQPVLVHDITFAVVPAAGVSPATVRDREEYDGIVNDDLNQYVTTVQKAGLTIHYFGAVISDNTIKSVREALGGAARVPADRVQVSANLPGPGVELDNGAPNLTSQHSHH
jgi:hypothetical protein